MSEVRRKSNDEIENRLSSLESGNKIQTKILSANVTSDGVVADLTFNNLVIGKWYEISGQVSLHVDSGASNTFVELRAVHDGIIIGRPYLLLQESVDTSEDIVKQAISLKFLATDSTLTFEANSATASSFIDGDGSKAETYIQLEERNDLVETGDFT